VLLAFRGEADPSPVTVFKSREFAIIFTGDPLSVVSL